MTRNTIPEPGKVSIGNLIKIDYLVILKKKPANGTFPSLRIGNRIYVVVRNKVEVVRTHTRSNPKTLT